jgi:hypothetical protein
MTNHCHDELLVCRNAFGSGHREDWTVDRLCSRQAGNVTDLSELLTRHREVCSFFSFFNRVVEEECHAQTSSRLENRYDARSDIRSFERLHRRSRVGC